jgi:hypothetical protein
LFPDNRQKKAALAPGAWPKSKPRGSGSAVSKEAPEALFVEKKLPPEGGKAGLQGV